MHKTLNDRSKQVEYTKDGIDYQLDIDYGFTCFGGQEPYFSITGRLSGSDGSRAFGYLHDEILEHAPKLEYLIKWHLTSIVQGPMHYVANGIFWWEQSLLDEPNPMYRGDTTAIGKKALENFKNTVVYGVTSYDKLALLNRDSIEIEFVRAWMKDRFDSLMEEFFKDMRKAKLIGMRNK